MSRLLRHGLSCPSCGSSDAVAEYETNFYCFSCHLSRIKLQSVTTAKPAVVTQELDNPALPDDATLSLPENARAWLYQYHFTDKLMEENSIMWSPLWERVIIPSFVGGQIIGFDARSLKPHQTKYLSFGTKKKVISMGEKFQTPIVIVEDMLSAMRVGQQFRTVCARGTHVTIESLSEVISKLDTKANFQFIIWFDGDTPGIVASDKLLPRLNWFGRTVSLSTPKDPKCYSDKEIHTKLKNFL